MKWIEKKMFVEARMQILWCTYALKIERYTAAFFVAIAAAAAFLYSTA